MGARPLTGKHPSYGFRLGAKGSVGMDILCSARGPIAWLTNSPCG